MMAMYPSRDLIRSGSSPMALVAEAEGSNRDSYILDPPLGITSFHASTSVPLSRSGSLNASTPFITPHQPATVDTSPSTLERVPTEILTTPPSSPEQPTQKTLLEGYGIKVRDFAHENVLPPVPVVKRLPRPVLPYGRQLKRVRTPEDDEDDAEWNKLLEKRRLDNEAKRAELERKSADPAALDEGFVGIRTNPHFDTSKWSPAGTSKTSPHAPRQLHGPSMPSTPPLALRLLRQFSRSPQSQPQPQYEVESQSQSQSQSLFQSQPPLDPASQTDSEFDGCATPLLTPQASTAFPFLNSSSFSESQVAHLISESQNPTSDIPASQMGYPESQSQTEGSVLANTLQPSPFDRDFTRNTSPSPPRPRKEIGFSTMDTELPSAAGYTSLRSRSTPSTPAKGDPPTPKSTMSSPSPRRNLKRVRDDSTPPPYDLKGNSASHSGPQGTPTSPPRYFLRNKRSPSSSPLSSPPSEPTPPLTDLSPQSPQRVTRVRASPTRAKLRSAGPRASPRRVSPRLSAMPMPVSGTRASGHAKTKDEAKESPNARPLRKSARGGASTNR
ncbi:hypothetical protein BD410DRAFT_823850 [Rickenella mellea]|uniref:Uncharacterized protein n=1 Tax=Rickenella mellea TaxID=50990 RepID=A0A4R5XFB5_9AGAM|nr:hypothetical protein BD410DRAFT_823850 [Rickenella mellea]